MKKFLLMAAVPVMLAATIPTGAQVYFDTGPGGAGNRLDDPGVGVNRLDDPNYGWPRSHWRRGYDAYARGECRTTRERVVTPDGRAIDLSREICG